MTYEDVLQRVGRFGTYQKRICIVIFCSAFTCALGNLTIIFTLFSPDHRCKIFAEVDSNQVTIPREKFSFNETSRCNETVIGANENGSLVTTYKVTNNTCTNGWIYADPDVSTVVTEFDLVCSNAWKKPLVISVFLIGELMGSLVGGPMSDRFGRRPVVLVSKLLEFSLFFAIGFSPTMTFYIVLRTLVGVPIYSSYTTSFVLGNELVGKKHRNKVSLSLYGGYCFGASIVPALGFLFKDWRWLMRCSGLLGILYIPFYWLLPESPYWLLSSGKHREAVTVLSNIAKINKKPSPEFDVMAVFKSEVNPAVGGVLERNVFASKQLPKFLLLQQEEEKMMDAVDLVDDKSKPIALYHLLTVPTLRWRMFAAALSWIVTNIVYFGLALNISALSGDRFWNAAISGILEYPGIILGFLLIQWIGRPLPLSLLMGAGGVCLAVAPFVEAASAVGMTALVIIGKTFVIGAFYINFSITGEMSPTLLRNASLGFASAAGKIGGFVAPYLMYIGETSSYFVPFLIMGGLACVSSLISILVLPETKGKVLPDSIDDAKLLKPIRCQQLCFKRRSTFGLPHSQSGV